MSAIGAKWIVVIVADRAAWIPVDHIGARARREAPSLRTIPVEARR